MTRSVPVSPLGPVLAELPSALLQAAQVVLLGALFWSLASTWAAP